jgi:hypothetical protein
MSNSMEARHCYDVDRRVHVVSIRHGAEHHAYIYDEESMPTVINTIVSHRLDMRSTLKRKAADALIYSISLGDSQEEAV